LPLSTILEFYFFGQCSMSVVLHFSEYHSELETKGTIDTSLCTVYLDVLL